MIREVEATMAKTSAPADRTTMIWNRLSEEFNRFMPVSSRNFLRTSSVGAGLVAAALCFAAPRQAEAQEILLTGPLAGAGSVHKLRLYRKERFEFAPTATFTLLDEYQRQIIAGARLSYNLTDSLAVDVWGGFSPSVLKTSAGLVEKVQSENEFRAAENTADREAGRQASVGNRLTSLNLGQDFEEQLGTIDWIVAPQLKFIPFRGKIALFQSLYVDSDLYFFGGPAVIGVSERTECSGAGRVDTGGCSSEIDSGQTEPDGTPIVIPNGVSFTTSSRIAIAPTVGLGFTFYLNRWASLGFEYRMTPFARNTGGFDNHGTGTDDEFPDESIDSEDRDVKLNQMLSVSIGISLPFNYQISE